VDLQVLKAVGLILGVQIVMWIINAIYYTFFLNNMNSTDQMGLYTLAIIYGSILFFLSALEVPILYFTRFLIFAINNL
jgi:hypothetical protein